MTFYDNGYGMKIECTKDPHIVRVEIYQSHDLYVPFMGLRNLSMTTESEKNSPKSSSESPSHILKLEAVVPKFLVPASPTSTTKQSGIKKGTLENSSIIDAIQKSVSEQVTLTSFKDVTTVVDSGKAPENIELVYEENDKGEDSSEPLVYFGLKSKLNFLIKLAQNFPKSKDFYITSDDDSIHVITPEELMVIAYTLPAFVVNEILSHIRSLKSNISHNGSPIFLCTGPGDLFSAVTAQYIGLRDGLSDGEFVVVSGTQDMVVWEDGKFSLQEESTMTS